MYSRDWSPLTLFHVAKVQINLDISPLSHYTDPGPTSSSNDAVKPSARFPCLFTSYTFTTNMIIWFTKTIQREREREREREKVRESKLEQRINMHNRYTAAKNCHFLSSCAMVSRTTMLSPPDTFTVKSVSSQYDVEAIRKAETSLASHHCCSWNSQNTTTMLCKLLAGYATFLPCEDKGATSSEAICAVMLWPVHFQKEPQDSQCLCLAMQFACYDVRSVCKSSHRI